MIPLKFRAKMIRSATFVLHKVSYGCRLPLSQVRPSLERGLHCSRVTSAKLYSKKHEWVELQGDTDRVRVGITQYAADALGDVVFAQLPSEGDQVGRGGECGAVESVKAASDIFSPVTGTVTQSNHLLDTRPALINSSPEQEAWMFELTLANRSELSSLMDKDGYDKFLRSVTEDLE